MNIFRISKNPINHSTRNYYSEYCGGGATWTHERAWSHLFQQKNYRIVKLPINLHECYRAVSSQRKPSQSVERSQPGFKLGTF